MFDTMQAFLRRVGEFKSPDKDIMKTGAFSCKGDIMAELGSQIMLFMAEISIVTLKTYRSSTPVPVTLMSCIQIATSRDGRDVLKQATSGSLDKPLAAQRASYEIPIAMYSSSDASVLTPSELDFTQAVKSLELSDQSIRHSLSKLVGILLASTQIERAVPIPQVAQKASKDGSSEQVDDGTSSTVAGTEVMKPMLTPQEMLVHLPTHFYKPAGSRNTRIGIFDFYAALFNKLRLSFVETNFSLIVAHLVSDIASTSRNRSIRYEALLTRLLVGSCSAI